MSDMVWFSHLMSDSRLNFYFYDPERDLSFEERSQLFDSINQGKPADLSLLPRKMYSDNYRKFSRKRLPNIYKVSNAFVSEEMVRVFQNFNTKNVLYFPVDFFGPNGSPKISETPYYGIAFLDSFDTIDLDADKGLSTNINDV